MAKIVNNFARKAKQAWLKKNIAENVKLVNYTELKAGQQSYLMWKK
jgi:hypothetical protein